MTPLPALPGELSIYTAAQTRTQWLEWLAADAAASDGGAALPALEAAHVDTVDGAGLQLLVALSHTLRERGHVLVLSAPSEALRSACSVLGLQALLPSAEEQTA